MERKCFVVIYFLDVWTNTSSLPISLSLEQITALFLSFSLFLSFLLYLSTPCPLLWWSRFLLLLLLPSPILHFCTALQSQDSDYSCLTDWHEAWRYDNNVQMFSFWQMLVLDFHRPESPYWANRRRRRRRQQQQNAYSTFPCVETNWKYCTQNEWSVNKPTVRQTKNTSLGRLMASWQTPRKWK